MGSFYQYKKYKSSITICSGFIHISTGLYGIQLTPEGEMKVCVLRYFIWIVMNQLSFESCLTSSSDSEQRRFLSFNTINSVFSDSESIDWFDWFVSIQTVVEASKIGEQEKNVSVCNFTYTNTIHTSSKVTHHSDVKPNLVSRNTPVFQKIKLQSVITLNHNTIQYTNVVVSAVNTWTVKIDWIKLSNAKSKDHVQNNSNAK